MPRLPGPEALGDAPSMRSGRDIARIGNIDTGAGELAKGLNALAAGFEAQDREQDAVDAARADARLTTGLLDLDRQFANDTDYETYQERYADSATRLQQEAAGMIRSPRVRERWMPRAEINVARGMDRVLGYGSRRRAQAHTDDLTGTVSQLTNYYASLGDSPEDDVRRDIARQNIAETLNLARGAGIVPPNALRQMQEQLDYGLPEVDARAYAERNPWAALRDLTQGDERANQPSSGQLSDQGLAFLQRLEPRPERRQTPTEQAAVARRLRSETTAISSWLTENVSVPMTQMQHDALVAYGRIRGQDALNAALPLINTGDWSTLRGLTGSSLEHMEQPAEPPARAPGPTSEGPRNPTARAIAGAATELGVSPEILAGIIHRETAGSMSATRRGGYGNAYLGLIQFSPENQQRYGIRPGMSVEEQMPAVVQYFRDRFERAGLDPAKATPAQLYAAVLAGDPRRVNAADINGSSAQAAGEIERRGRQWWSRHGEGVEVAQAPTGTMTDASPSATQPRTPSAPAGPDRTRELQTIGDMLMGEAPTSRFQNLTPERRRAITTQVRNGLKNITRDEINGDIERIKRTGQPLVRPDGTSSFDRAKLVFEPNELARIQLQRQEAERTFAATEPLNNMSEEQGFAHLDRFTPSETADDESYHVAARVQDRAQRQFDRILEVRNRDSAQAVMGGRVRGSGTGQRQVIAPDGSVTTLPGEDDLRQRPALEVETAINTVRRRIPDANISVDEDGNVSVEVASGRPEDVQEVWRTIIDARLQAQDRLGIQRNLITRGESERLLALPRNLSTADPADIERRLRQAADRAYATYGETYGRLAFDNAVRNSRLSGDNANFASGLVTSLLRGERFTRPAIERFMRLNQMDQETRLWLGTMADRPGASDADEANFLFRNSGITGRGFDAAGGLTNRGDPREDRPGISHIMPSPDAPRSFAGRPLSSQAERQFETPTPDEIDWLRANPDQWQLFDEDFGPGSAATYLQGQTPPRGARSR